VGITSLARWRSCVVGSADDAVDAAVVVDAVIVNDALRFSAGARSNGYNP
jgi:hypothetical protein